MSPPLPSEPVPTSDAVRFVLDGEVRSLADVDPTRTVLGYLREDLGRTGTKEGCAEGDCGACTVVVVDLTGDRLRYRAVNSCILFLPTLDGKALITVESLGGRDGALHPVQQALVDCHGSQCGFCTPGFVMSLFALYQARRTPAREEINEALAGNLCRCTGYRPIVEAARRMGELPPARPTDALSPATLLERLRAIRRRDGLALRYGTRRYFAPASLAELAALRDAHPEAWLLAGGTDVGLWVTKQHRDLATIVYVGHVPELRRIDVTDTHLEVGAAASLTDAGEAMERHFPDLREVLRRFASPPVRNAGTLGGNIANGSPIGDSMPALMVLGARLVLRRGPRTRELPLDQFYLGYQQTALEPGEFLERVRIPLAAAHGLLRAYKVSKRFDQDISAVCGAYWVALEGGRVRGARVAYGGMAATPARAPGCEQALIGREWSEATVAIAAAQLDRDYAAITDLRATASYRRLVAQNLLSRFFLETTGTTGTPPAPTRVTEIAVESGA